MIRLNVSRADMTVEESETLTAGRVGLKCAFTFSGEWGGLQKIATFSGSQTKSVTLNEDEITVPWECFVNAENYRLSVAVTGTKPDGTIVIPSVYAVVGKIQRGAVLAEPGAEPTPDVVAQIQQNAANALAVAQGVQARADSGEFDGQDGYSPSATVEQTEGGAIVRVTDKDGTTTATLTNGQDGAPGQPGTPGADGITPTIGENGNWYLGTTDTGKPSRGQQGVPGTPGTPGEPGEPGADGQDGYSPAVTITAITDGHRVNITDKTHPSGQSFDVMDGAPGQPGPQGPQGIQGPAGPAGETPVKGVDYFTAAEIAEIEADAAEAALSEVPTWAKQPTKPSYTASEVGALPDDTVIPTALSQLSADSTHRTVTDAEKSTWNGKGTYSKPSGGIPKTDLASAVQTSLGLADSALQSVSTSQVSPSPTDPYEPDYNSQKAINAHLYAKESEWNGKLSPSGDGSNVTAAFTAASSRANIATGEKLSVMFGKIAKWLADIKTVAFTGSYNDLSNKPTIPTVPTNVSAFTNDSGYQTAAQVTSAVNSGVSNKENKGKITISGVEKTANTHTVTIVTNGVTSTFNLVGVS